MTLAIRPLTADDADAYRRLRLRALAEHPEAFTSSADEEAGKPLAALAKRIAPGADAPHDVVLGAFDDGTLVGFVGLDVDPRAKVRHRGHVFGMYVERAHARRGVGRALLDALVAHAAAAPSLMQLVLTVTAGNAAACTLYERAGFTTFGREPRAVIVDGRPYDKLHMIRLLAPLPAAA